MPYVTHNHTKEKKEGALAWGKSENQASLHYNSHAGTISPPFWEGSSMAQTIPIHVKHAPLVKPWWLTFHVSMFGWFGNAMNPKTTRGEGGGREKKTV